MSPELGVPAVFVVPPSHRGGTFGTVKGQTILGRLLLTRRNIRPTGVRNQSSPSSPSNQPSPSIADEEPTAPHSSRCAGRTGRTMCTSRGRVGEIRGVVATNP
ncbi:hypothetical protein GCM10022227_33210 [Streptomyces sedi]